MIHPILLTTESNLTPPRILQEFLEDLHNHYRAGDINFSFGVENNSNGSSNCSCTGFWGILKVLAAIGITILVDFILFICLMAYCARRKVIKAEKEQRMVRWLEEKVNRDRHTALEMSEDNCSKNHFHIPNHLRMSQIDSSREISGSSHLCLVP